MERRRILILDTTLRDGEQAPGFAMNLGEKLEVAKRLEKLRVDAIEAGFPASGPGDFDGVQAVAEVVRGCTVAALCRCVEADIDAAVSALACAERPRLHLFIAASPLHMEFKLRMNKEQVMERAVSAVRYAKRFCGDIEFSAEDASRSDPAFVRDMFGKVIEAGAAVVNFTDTVGCAVPKEISGWIAYLREHTPGIDRAVLSVHCHNDLGLAVANSIAAIQSGAQQAECTINGIGERAGNASLEELVMVLRVRDDYFELQTGIDTSQIYAASRLVSQVTGVRLPPNKAVVGDNAFAHAAGIHQHGFLAKKETYEIMSPQSIGIPQGRIVLGRHSGRHAFAQRLEDMGQSVDEETFEKLFAAFKELAGKKKTVDDRDIEALLLDCLPSVPETWMLEHWMLSIGSQIKAAAAVTLCHRDGRKKKADCMGDGPIDAAFKSINQITGREPALELYEIDAITGGSSSQGQTMVKIAVKGRRWNGRGVSTDVIESSIKAYLAAINAMEWDLAAGVT